MKKLQKRYFELRQSKVDERVIEGIALRYGDVATLPWGDERFVSGAFEWDDVILNRQHSRDRPLARTDAGLEIIDDSRELAIRATLPDTQEANDTLELVRQGILRGLSIEFMPIKERLEDNVNVIEKATLYGVAVVDKPAYPASELREDGVEEKQLNNFDWWRVM